MRTLRRGRQMSQEELADRAGVHRTYLGGVERGERNPSLRNITRIAEALGVPTGDLFHEENRRQVLPQLAEDRTTSRFIRGPSTTRRRSKRQSE